MATCAVCGYEAAEAFKFCPECGATLGADGREQRKVVTVLFCDVVGSTALGEAVDPEVTRLLLARYFERMKGIVERHGGTVEKFIGDAVMAVFGIPQAHEDDALRACRAALQMQQTLPELALAGTVGINTGEVVTGTEERLATGDAVNVASRLQHAADAGEVLLGEATFELVRGAVEVEAREPFTLKGKAQPVEAFRLLSVREVEPRGGPRFVGRTRANSRSSRRRGSELRARAAASSSRLRGKRALASRASSPRPSRRSMPVSFRDAASRTARASRTGRSSR